MVDCFDDKPHALQSTLVLIGRIVEVSISVMVPVNFDGFPYQYSEVL